MTARKLGDIITKDFCTNNPSTGAATDADLLPTVAVYEDDTDTGLSGATVTKRTGLTGDYRVAVVATAGNGFEVGKSYNVIVSATVDGVAAKACIYSFTLDSKRLADLNDIAAGTAMTLTSAYDAAKTAAPETGGNIAAIKARTDNLPDDPADESLVIAAINSRLAAVDYTAPDNAGIAALPTLAEIEASTALAKEASLTILRALSWENVAISSFTYDSAGKCTGCVATLKDVNGTVIKTQTMVASYDSSGNLTGFTEV